MAQRSFSCAFCVHRIRHAGASLCCPHAMQPTHDHGTLQGQCKSQGLPWLPKNHYAGSSPSRAPFFVLLIAVEPRVVFPTDFFPFSLSPESLTFKLHFSAKFLPTSCCSSAQVITHGLCASLPPGLLPECAGVPVDADYWWVYSTNFWDTINVGIMRRVACMHFAPLWTQLMGLL